jgi:menaquinone-9 beta-reductase
MDFDYFLTRYIKSDYADFRQGHELKSIIRKDNNLILEIKNNDHVYKLSTSLLIGAEGDRSVTARTLSGHKRDPNHYCGGIRAYYKGVEGMHQMNYIELHFLKDLLPGYLWIFPLPGGYANVGVGMLTAAISRKRINLKESMLKAITTHPEFQERFRYAKMDGQIQGWGLPLGSIKRKLTGDNYILTGDAASMIDPFTGEGISNAMFCGMAAAETAIKAATSGSYTDNLLSGYNERVYKRLWNELRVSHGLQKLCNYPWLFNFVVGKAEKNAAFKETLSCMFEDLDLRAKFRQPSFYFKLLFGGK